MSLVELAGDEIVQVCVGTHQARLGLANGLSLAIEVPLRLTNGDEAREASPPFGPAASFLLGLLGHRAASIEVRGGRRLALATPAGTLEAESTGSGHEAFHIVDEAGVRVFY